MAKWLVEEYRQNLGIKVSPGFYACHVRGWKCSTQWHI